MGQLHSIPESRPTQPLDFELELADRVDAIFDHFNREYCESTAVGLTQCVVQMMTLGAIERGRLPPP
jgi:hypothetical protein